MITATQTVSLPSKNRAPFSIWFVVARTCLSSLSLVALVGCARSDPNSNGNGLQALESTEHYFGTVRQGEVLSHSFSLVNSMKTNVKIIGVLTSCTCVVAGDKTFSVSEIGPGEQALLPVKFSSSSPMESVEGRVIVRYCSVESPQLMKQLRLRVRADVLQDYRVVPALVDVGKIDGLDDPEIRRVIEIEPRALTDLSIQDVSTSNDFITPRIIDGEGTCSVEVKLDLSRIVRSQKLNGLVLVSTNSTRMPTAAIRIQGTYQPAVTASPDAIVVPSNKFGVREREIQFLTARAARIVSAVASEDGIRVSWHKNQLSEQHIVHLSIPPCTTKPLKAELSIEFEFDATGSGAEIVHRSVDIPIYRFQQRGEE